MKFVVKDKDQLEKVTTFISFAQMSQGDSVQIESTAEYAERVIALSE